MFWYKIMLNMNVRKLINDSHLHEEQMRWAEKKNYQQTDFHKKQRNFPVKTYSYGRTVETRI